MPKNPDYHLWRRFPTKPFRRYACTLKPANTEAGYEVVDHDPAVADVGFLHAMADHLRSPRVDVTRVDGNLTTRHTRLGDDHFKAAVRTVPNAALCSTGRDK